MIDKIKSLFGLGPKVNYAQLMKEGAIIVDVRSKGEFSGGHIKKSVNIPVDSIGNQLHLLNDKNQHIITCCASGMRSGMAKGVLKGKGYKNVYNGGSYISLNNKL